MPQVNPAMYLGFLPDAVRKLLGPAQHRVQHMQGAALLVSHHLSNGMSAATREDQDRAGDAGC